MGKDKADGGNVLAELLVLHAEIDARIAQVSASYAGQLTCKPGCRDCCRDDLTVFGIEALRIRAFCRQLLEEEKPHPKGGCAFLSPEGHCRIYEHRPYVCRTQGLPLRWIEDDNEYRDICPLNAPAADPGALEPEHCWEIGPFEDLLRRLQERLERGTAHTPTPLTKGLQRIALRSLFG